MRVSSSLMVGRYLKQINNSYENQTKLMEQSDGSNLHRPSDDSVRYSRYLRYQNSNTENLQYQDNVKAGISWMKTADASMNNMTDIYTTLKEKTIDAANDTNGELDLMAIAKEFKAKLYEMVSLGNSQQGDRYLFSGQSDLTQPFVISVEDRDRGLPKTLDDPQAKFFTTTNDLSVDSSGSLTQMLTLNGDDGNIYYLNTMNGYVYTEDFVMNGYKDRIASGQNHVAEGDEVAKLTYFASSDVNVASYFMNTGEIEKISTIDITDSSGATTTKKYNYGDILPLNANETAVADTEVEITDVNGNKRVVKAGDIVGPLGTGEVARVSPPLRATLSGSTETTVLTGSTQYTYIDSSGNVNQDTIDAGKYLFGNGATAPLNAGDTVVVGMDVQITDANGNTSIVPAGTSFTLTAGDEVAVIGPHLSTPTATGVTIIDTSTSPPSATTTSYASGTVLPPLTATQTLVAGMDIDITDASGNVITYPAGSKIKPWSATETAAVGTTQSNISQSAGPYNYLVVSSTGTIASATCGSQETLVDSGATPPISKLNVGDTAIVGIPVEITDATGNTTRVPAGEAFTVATGDVIKTISPQSNVPNSVAATIVDTTNVSSGGAPIITSVTYAPGSTLPALGANQTLVVGMDVDITDASGNVTTYSAGTQISPWATTDVATVASSMPVYSLATTTTTYKSGDTLLDSSTNPPTGLAGPYETMVMGMDVQITDASGNVRVIPAGDAFTLVKGDTAVVIGAQMNPTTTGVTVANSVGPLTTTRYSPGDAIVMNVGETATAGLDVEIQDSSGNVLRTIVAGDTFTLNSGETAVLTNVSSQPGAGGIPARTTTFSFETVRQPIVTYQGDAKYISMVKLNGTVDQTADTVNTTGQDLNGSDIFDDANSGNQVQLMSNGTLCYVSSGTAMLNNMFTVCAKLEMGNNRWMSTDGITIADQAHETVVTAETKVAARQNVYDSVSTMLDKQNEGITSDINDVSATDVAELAVRLMEAQTIYNMSLSVGSRILPPTLADYLS